MYPKLPFQIIYKHLLWDPNHKLLRKIIFSLLFFYFILFSNDENPRLKARNNKPQGFIIRYNFCTQNQIKTTGSRPTNKTQGLILQGSKLWPQRNLKGLIIRFNFYSRTTFIFFSHFFVWSQRREPQGFTYKVQFSHNNYYKVQFFLTWNHFLAPIFSKF